MTKKISELTEDTSPANTAEVELNIGGLSRRSSLTNILKELISSAAQGDILYFNGTTWTRLAAGNSGEFLKTLGAGANPSWAASAGGVTSGPRAFIDNCVITVTVSSNNLTVALKTVAGTDPSSSDKITVRIGDAKREITSALSVTKNAGTNWCNAGSAELATKEIDYFVYLGYNATDGVVIGFSRIPEAKIYSDFSTTSTNEKYAGISTITNAAAGDNYVNIGRFAATLSAGAGYTWTVPTFTAINLINHPIYNTRLLSYTPAWASSGTQPAISNGTLTGKYIIENSKVTVYISQSMGGSTTFGTGTYKWSLPLAVVNETLGYAYALDSGTAYHLGIAGMKPAEASQVQVYPEAGASPWAQTIPQTWASSDTAQIVYPYWI